MQITGTVRGLVMRRPWVTGGVAAVMVLAAGGVTWWATAGGSKASASAPTYRLVAASVQTIKQSVSTSGTVEPADQESLSFPSSGSVTSVRVAAGDTVKKNQVLGTIDSAALAAQLAEAQATLAQDQARVSTDQMQGITGAQLTADEAAVNAAQGQVDSAQTAMNSATLRSPIDGVVETVNVAVGDQLGSSSGNGGNGNSNSGNGSNGSNGSSGSSAAFVVIGTSSWLVNATVDDTQVNLVKKGNQAQFTSGATTVYGTVSSVGMVATSSSGSATYPVTVKVTGSPSGLHAGSTVTMSIVYKQLTDVLTVPTLAVHSSSGQSYVEELSGTTRVKHNVTTGLSSGGLTQIVSGIAEGTQVVVDIPQVAGGNGSTGTNNRTGRTGGNGFFGGGGGFSGGGGFGGDGGQVVINKNSQGSGK